MTPELARAVAERYAGSRAARGYVAAKLRADPIASRLVALGRERPLGRVVDLACGRGQLGVALLLAGVADDVHGVDWDAAKIDVARAASRGLPARWDVGDIRGVAVEPCDTVLLVDALHYLDEAEQDALLSRAAAAERAVVVRELDPDRGWRSAITRAQEAVTTALGYNAGRRLAYRPVADLARPLEARGFSVSVEPAWGRTPFSNVLVFAERA